MNITLRLLLFTGLVAIFCASCTKVEELFPEPYVRNDKPFSVEKVPVRGGTVMLERVVGGVPRQLNIESTSLTFQIGDSLILTATPKNGYSFINWVCDGKPLSDQPKYQFCLDGKDVDENGKVKYHYEARFGLDYSIQSIPSIDEVIPADLITAMGPYLHFGDTPPRIDSCFSALDFIVLDTLIQNDTTEDYFFPIQPQRFDYPRNTFLFEGQHRCIAESHYYERCNFVDYFYYSATAQDSIFIMGHDDCFTAYFKQTWKAWIHPDLAGLDHLRNVTRRESIILSGRVTDEGIIDFHWGMCVESYNPADYPYIGANPGHSGQPGIHDIMIFSYKDDNGHDLLLPYDPTFQKHE